MRRPLALLAAVAAVAVCVGLTAAPASAERVTGRDQSGDVGRVVDDRVQRAARPAVDVVRYAVRNGDHRITVLMRFRDLQPRGRSFSAGTYLTYDGDGAGFADLGVDAGRGNRAGTVFFNGGSRDRCDVRHRIDYRRDVVRLDLPARCLGRPRAIEAVLATSIVPRRGGVTYADLAPATYRQLRSVYQLEGGVLPTVRVRRG